MNNHQSKVIDFDSRKVKFEKIHKIKNIITQIEDEIQILSGKLSHGRHEYINTSAAAIMEQFRELNNIGYEPNVYDGKRLPSYFIMKQSIVDDESIKGLLRIDDFKEISEIINDIPFVMEVYLKEYDKSKYLDKKEHIINFDKVKSINILTTM